MSKRQPLMLCLALLAVTTAPVGFGQVTNVFDDFSTDPFEEGNPRWGRNQSDPHTAAWIPPEAPLCVGTLPDLTEIFSPYFECGNDQQPAPNNFPCSIYSEANIEDIGEVPANFGFVALNSGKDQRSNIYQRERVTIADVQVRMILEASGGCRFDNPADGFGVTLVELQNEPLLGDGGGSNGVTGYVCPEGQGCHENDGNNDGVLDGGQQIIFEADVNGGNAGDARSATREDHVGIYYVPQGAPGGNVPPPPNGPTILMPEGVLLHSRTNIIDAQADYVPNRFEITAFLKGQTAAIELDLLDQNIDFGRVAQVTFDGLSSFEGYVVAAGATGGRDAANYLHEIEISAIEGECDVIPAPAAFTHRFTGLQDDECGDFVPGQNIGVNVDIANLRDIGACPIDTTVVRDTLPLGFTVAGSPSQNGVIIPAADPDVDRTAVEWTLTPAQINAGVALNYTATANFPDAEETEFEFNLTYSELAVSDARADVDILSPVGGFDPFCGGITCWNILGPFRNPFCDPSCIEEDGAVPSRFLQADWAVADQDNDGTAESGVADLVWRPGLPVNIVFNDDLARTGDDLLSDAFSPSPGLHPTPLETTLNGGGSAPEVFEHTNGDSLINFQSEVFGGVNLGSFAYAQCYVESDATREVFVKAGASKNFFVELNGRTIIQRNNCLGITSCRARTSACSGARNPEKSVVPADVDDPNTDIDEREPITLIQGINTLLVGVHNEDDVFSGKWDFWIRFQDSADNGGGALPITEGLTIRLTPGGTNEVGLVPGDYNSDGGRDISDPIAHLNFQFGGFELDPCYVVAGTNPPVLRDTGVAILDYNGDGSVDISDPIGDLNFQFGGTGVPHVLGDVCRVFDDEGCIEICTP